jgi:mannose-1-phosphate guanylyltransferase / mannose-6-phosphate isomerase
MIAVAERTMNIRPLIMCGGSGTRLWPVSRDSFPKQFAPLLGARSSFQETVLRVADPDRFDPPLIVAGQKHHFMIQRQLDEIGVKAERLLEPMARDSGPAIVAGVSLIAERDPATPVLVLAADHMVRDGAGFRATVAGALAAAGAGRIVTFGIEPAFAATAYGYIEPGAPLPGGGAARLVSRFVEKPGAEAALAYLKAGFLWNSGNFLFRADVLLAEYARFAPDSLVAIQAAVAQARDDLGGKVLDAGHFQRAEKQSIDYAVMERTQLMAVVPGRFGWSDIGTWDALWDMAERDDDGNVLRGDVVTLEARNSFVSTDGAVVGLIGVSGLVVVATRDAVLVTDRERSGEVKGLVDQLKARGVTAATEHVRIDRPWGWHQTTERGEGFHVRRIMIYPGKHMSLHRHSHRTEHWVMVKGAADITVGDDTRVLSQNMSQFVARGVPHRVGNSTAADIEIIEVATGSYLGEDDIVRLDDDADPF